MSDDDTDENSPREKPEGHVLDLVAAERAAVILRQSFHTFTRSRVVCRRIRRGSGFWHCKASASLGNEGGRLHELLEQRARLRLLADCESRLAGYRQFARALERLALDEAEAAAASISTREGGYDDDDEHAAGGSGVRVTGLVHLSYLCDELRVHLGHWSCISRAALDSPWLRFQLHRVEPALLETRAALSALRHACLWWLERLVRTGVRAFARAQLNSLPIADAYSLVRGVEEFNSLLTIIGREEAADPSSSPSCGHSTTSRAITASASREYLRWTHAACTNSPSQADVRTIKPMSFVRFLGVLASERAKAEAERCLHLLLAGSGRLVIGGGARMALATSLPPARAAGAAALYKRMGLGGGLVAAVTGERSDTSDYHSATGSAISVAAGKQGAVPAAAELSFAERALLDWAQREQEYVNKIVAIACQTTTMLQKSGGTSKGFVAANNREADPTLIAASETSMPARADPKRKSVSWGDSQDATVKANLSNRYFDLLWKSFGVGISEYSKSQLPWGVLLMAGAGGNKKAPHLGSTDYCSIDAVLQFGQALERFASRGALSASCGRQLDLAALRLHASAALAQWDASLCLTLASAQSDKCQPAPLVDGQFSTKTAVLLRNAYAMLQGLQIAFERRFGARRKGPSASQQPAVEYRIQWEILQRLQILADMTERWCQHKFAQYIFDYRLSQFLLVTHSDLSILGTELGKSLCLLSCDGSDADPFPSQWRHLSLAFGRTEALARAATSALAKRSSVVANKFFAAALPPSKAWRRDSHSSTGSAKKRASSYAEELTDVLLRPLIEGSRQLAVAAQVGTIVCVVKSVLEAWAQQLLKQKIKFSWEGADQLEADVKAVRAWLSSNISSEEVKRAVLEAEPFRVITGIVQLLKRQPCKLRQRTPAMPSASTSAGQQDGRSDHAEAASGGHDSLDEMDFASAVPDKSEWLALRQHGPGRASRLFLPCMNSKTDLAA